MNHLRLDRIGAAARSQLAVTSIGLALAGVVLVSALAASLANAQTPQPTGTGTATTPQATSTATRAATTTGTPATATATPTSTSLPNRGAAGAVGAGLLVPDRQTPVPAVPAQVQQAPVQQQPAATQQSVAPPRSGDGGLLNDTDDGPLAPASAVALLIGIGLLATGAVLRLQRRPKDL